VRSGLTKGDVMIASICMGWEMCIISFVEDWASMKQDLLEESMGLELHRRLTVSQDTPHHTLLCHRLGQFNTRVIRTIYTSP
jgi:hypothetical protein